MKRIWARIGMSLMVPDEEYEKLKKRTERNGDYEFDGSNKLAKRFVKDGKPDGECYIPEDIFDFCEEE